MVTIEPPAVVDPTPLPPGDSTPLALGGESVPADAGLLVFVAIGALGSAHCLGMCGPLVTVYADRLPGGDDRGPGWPAIRGHLLFNAGRTASYAVLGALLGGLGGLLFEAARVATVADRARAVAGVVVGLAILVAGAGYLRGGGGGAGLRLPYLDRAFARVTAAVTARVDEWVRGPRVAALGAVHALLPCPLLAPAYLYALATGSAISGGLALFALGLGTFPTVFAYGTALGSLGTDRRVVIHRALGVAFLVLGYLPLAHGLRLLGVGVPAPPVHPPVFGPLG